MSMKSKEGKSIILSGMYASMRVNHLINFEAYNDLKIIKWLHFNKSQLYGYELEKGEVIDVKIIQVHPIEQKINMTIV